MNSQPNLRLPAATLFLATVFVLGLPLAAVAQHADIQVEATTDDQLVTGLVDLNASPAVTDFPVRVFERWFENQSGNAYRGNDPGFNSGGASSLPAGITPLRQDHPLGFNLKAFNLPDDGFTNLAFWDGAGAVDFDPVAAGHQLNVTGTAPGLAVAEGSAIDVLGYDFTAFSGGTLHDHLLFTLSNDSGPPEEGVYMWAMELTMNTYEPSDPVYLVLETFESPLPALDQAKSWATANLATLDAPEPSTLVLCLVASAAAVSCLGRSSRRRRTTE